MGNWELGIGNWNRNDQGSPEPYAPTPLRMEIGHSLLRGVGGGWHWELGIGNWELEKFKF